MEMSQEMERKQYGEYTYTDAWVWRINYSIFQNGYTAIAIEDVGFVSLLKRSRLNILSYTH